MSNYWPFFLLLLIPYIWWTQRKTRVDLSPKHLRLSGLVRSAIVVLLALALTQPVIYRSGALVSVMYLLDISQSVLPADIQAGIQWIQETNASGKPDHARYIPFGANAAAVDTVDQVRTVSIAETAGDRRNRPKRNQHRRGVGKCARKFCATSPQTAGPDIRRK